MLDAMQYAQLRQEAQKIDSEIKQLSNAQNGQIVQLHRKAAALYLQLYQNKIEAYSATRYIHHKRKSGIDEAREASRFAKKESDQNKDFLNDIYFVREYVWSIYDGYLKITESGDDLLAEDDDEDTPIQASPEDFERKLGAAHRIFELTTEPLPCIRAAFAISKEAKQRKKWEKKWEIVREFGQKLQPDTISTDRKEINGRLSISDYQKWLYMVTRAALELHQYEECMTYARMGIEKYPDESLHFWRWEALAKIQSGDVSGGIEQLKYVDTRFPKQWYVQGDIAQAYMRLEQYQDAWLWFCRAASAPGDIKGRIKQLKDMCDILQFREEWQAAYQHLLLVWAVEAAFGTKGTYLERTKQRIIALKKAHADIFPQSTDDISTQPISLGAALKPCRTLWQKTLAEATPSKQGKVVRINEQQQFGFIEDERGERYHFKFRAFVHGQPQLYMQVRFTAEEAFDKKKGQMGSIATNIRPLKLS